MTDKEKLTKVRAEVERLHNEYRNKKGALYFRKALRTVLFIIDSMQEEPKECMYSKDNYTDEDRKVLCDGCEEECEYAQNGKPVSEDLQKAMYLDENGNPTPAKETEYTKGFLKGANWQKEQLLAKAFDFTKEHNTACVLASECLRNHGWFNRERVFNDLFRHLSCVDKLFEGKFCGKTKVIVIKEN